MDTRRMARSRTVKPEPAEEPIIHQSCNRAQTISSNVTPAPEQVHSSGETTVPDHDIQMGGLGNGHASPQHGAVNKHASVVNGRAPNGYINGLTKGYNMNGHSLNAHSQTPTRNGSDHMQDQPLSDATASQPEDDAMQKIGANSRQLIQTIQKLEQLNIKATLPSLPKFVVVGDQSAGKSSIIEALCNITLPRSQGTCTRCPFQITTSATGTGTFWKCTVSLLSQYSYEPSVKANRQTGTRFNRWLELSSPEVVHFATVTRKQDLEMTLRRAQLAILNPAVGPSTYTSITHPEHAVRGVAFSPNTIQLKVEAADLPELSVIDLPGSINVHEDNDEQHLVEFIESLVKSHLGDEQTMVLLTCSADQDIENSTTFRFVKEAKATDRALGVLTKLDLMHTNKAEQIWKMLNHQKFPLRNGSWFVTRQLSQDQLEAGVSHGEARLREEAFFSSSPWAEVSKAFPQQVGIGNLQAALSKCLTAHILEALPEIVKRVETRLKQVEQELVLLPERSKHAQITVVSEVTEIANVINQQIKGECTSTIFLQGYKQALKLFHGALAASRPTVDLNTPGYEKPAFEIGSSDNETVSTPTPTPLQMRMAATPGRTTATPGRMTGTPIAASKKRKVDATTPMAYVETPSRRVKSETGIQTSPRTLKFKLDGVRAQYEAGATSGLPDSPSQKVTEVLILAGLESWDALIDVLLARMKRVTLELVTSGKNEVLRTRSHTELFRKTGITLEGLVDETITEQAKVIKYILKCEQHKPITLSDMRAGNAAIAGVLHKDRLKIRIDEHFDTMEGMGAKITRPADRAKKLTDQPFLNEALGTDSYSTEITELARILNYYDIASAQFSDTVAKHLALGLQHHIKETVKQTLLEQLQPLDEEHCLQLIAEDPRREVLRRNLLEEKEKLEKAKRELEALPAQA